MFLPSRWKFPPSLRLIRPFVASYSFIAADTLCDLVSLTFDLLTLVSGHTWRVMWSISPPSLKILRLSVLELWVLTSPIGYHWHCVCSHCACAVSRDLWVGGNFFSHIFEIPDPDLPIHYTTCMALRSHTRTVVRECCKGDDQSQWRRANFDPPATPKPLNRSSPKLAQVIMSGYLPPCKI